MNYLTTKELAAEMEVHPRTVKRWWKKLGAAPTCYASGGHRWTRRRATLLIKRWQGYWAARGTTPAIIKDKFAGIYEDPAQLVLRFK